MWAPGPVWTGAEILVTTGIRTPDRHTRSQSLCQLGCPGPYIDQCFDKLFITPVVQNLFFYISFFFPLGAAVAQLIRCCATNRTVDCSIPAGVIGILP